MIKANAAIAAITVVLAGTALSAAAPAGTAQAATAICHSARHPGLAARIAADIQLARRGRVSSVAVRVNDPALGLDCWLNTTERFDSASVVKATILAALLRKAMDQHRFLTATEAARARAMITVSDNAAASALWRELGHAAIQHFLNLAGMRETALGPGGAWGLTQITTSDEVHLLRLLLYPNGVLTTASRNYELSLMAQVTPGQRWGVPAGAPTRFTAHVKNGWLPLSPHRWRINSIGCFTGHGAGYSMAILTEDNPSMPYGITTVEAIARAVNHDLNPGAASVVAPSAPSPGWGTPDETIP